MMSGRAGPVPDFLAILKAYLVDVKTEVEE